MQYYDTGPIGVALTVLLVGFILLNIARARGEKGLQIRKISGLVAIEEAIGRATEMGKPVLMIPGINVLNANAAQAINIFAYVTRLAARMSNPILLCTADPAVYAVAQETIRGVYQSEGLLDRYDVDSVRFLTDRQFAFAAAVSGTILREKTAAAFFLGDFYAESLIFAETANRVGAIQVAGSTQNTQTPFFIAACDYVLIGDEFYAASAYLTREPVLVGSLVGQDWAKVMVLLLVLIGCLSNTVQVQGMTEVIRTGTDQGIEYLGEPRRITISDTFFNHLFKPDTKTEDLPVRQKRPPEVEGQ